MYTAHVAADVREQEAGARRGFQDVVRATERDASARNNFTAGKQISDHF